MSWAKSNRGNKKKDSNSAPEPSEDGGGTEALVLTNGNGCQLVLQWFREFLPTYLPEEICILDW